jgi:tetratricopeptide (TPR) repeat protein
VKRAIVVVACLASTVIAIATPAFAANMWGTSWQTYYISNDKYGRCGDYRLPPSTRIPACLASFHGGLLNSADTLTLLDELSDALEEQSDYAGAITVLDDAVKLANARDILEQRYYRSQAYILNGQADKALTDMTALQKDTNSLYAYAGLGDVAADQGRLDEALKYYDQAAEKNDANFGIRMNRAKLYARTGRYEEAMAQDDSIVNDLASLSYGYANRCWDRAIANRDLDLAIADCTKSLTIFPDFTNTLDSRGFAYFRQGRWNEAIADYSAALTHSPNFTSSLYMRGIAELRKGEVEKGNEDIKQAEAIYPRISAQYANYGVVP